MNLGRYDEALQAFHKAIEINPRFADAWYCKGLALNKHGRTAEANSAFAKAKEMGYKD